jgi:hypothetical protein
MPTPYQELVDTIVESGVSRAEARHAVNSCALAMAKQGTVAYTGSALLMYFMNTNPASAIGYGTAAFGAGAAHALIKSPDCREVRRAVRFWTHAQFQ